MIIVLFKDGDTNDLNNYHGITLLSVLGKILVGVLNNRLSKVCLDYNLLDENQCGFRRGYRTSDHIFTLSTLINHYTKVKDKKLYLCFVDFRKAFDKVSQCPVIIEIRNRRKIYEYYKVNVCTSKIMCKS